MDWLNNFVYVPVWMLILMLFLGSGFMQYVIVDLVRLITKRAERKAQSQQESAKILRIVSPAEAMEEGKKAHR